MNADFNPQFAKLGEILVNNGKATESGINEALVQQKTTNEKIGTTLIEMGLLEEDDFTMAYGQQLGYKKTDNFILSLSISIFFIFPFIFIKGPLFILT